MKTVNIARIAPKSLMMFEKMVPDGSTIGRDP